MKLQLFGLAKTRNHNCFWKSDFINLWKLYETLLLKSITEIDISFNLKGNKSKTEKDDFFCNCRRIPFCHKYKSLNISTTYRLHIIFLEKLFQSKFNTMYSLNFESNHILKLQLLHVCLFIVKCKIGPKLLQ